MQSSLRNLSLFEQRKLCLSKVGVFIGKKAYLSNYIHESTIPTDHFKSSLFKLPLPKLKDTLQRVSESAKPLLSVSELDVLNNDLSGFMNRYGPSIQSQLADKAKRQNYMADFWTETYLLSRNPLPIYSNPILTFGDDTKCKGDPILKCATLIHNTMRFKKTLDDNKLSPDIFGYSIHNKDNEKYAKYIQYFPNKLGLLTSYYMKKYPLCMSQYNQMFNTCRIPDFHCDHLSTLQNCDEINTRNVSLMYKGECYIIQVVDENGLLYSVETIIKALSEILASVRRDSNTSYPIGVFTSLPRSEWAKIRHNLIKLDPINHQNMKLIEQSLFTICLDDYETKDEEDTISHFMKNNFENRFFDKSFQIMIDSNGKAVINTEHTWGDGLPILRYLEEMHRVQVINEDKEINNSCFYKKLEFKNLESLSGSFDYAKDFYNEMKHNFVLNSVKEFSLTRNLLQTHKLNADALIQIAFQVAYYWQFRRLPNVYESANMLAFEHGRTDTMRPTTVLSKKFVESFCDSDNPDKNTFLPILRDACDYHSKLVVNTLKGNGWDRHMYSLEKIASKIDKNYVNNTRLFKNKSYRRLTQNFDISSSTLMSDIVKAGCFGPPTINSLALPYRINNQFAGAIVANFKPEFGGVDGAEFTRYLKMSFSSLAKLLN